MKVIAFVGSARRKHTYAASEQFLKNLQSFGNVEYEVVLLSDYQIGVCRGCKLCLDKGEELCPLKDDRDKLIAKINDSDGVLFATPNYSFNVSGILKVFLDRLGFVFHRPSFFGKVCTSIVVQGIYGGKKINKYLDFVGKGLGFDVVKGCCLNSLEPMTVKCQRKLEKVIYSQSRKFYTSLMKKEYPVPGLFELMIFRMARSSIQMMLNESWKDYEYFNKKGWFRTDYYYSTQLNLIKILCGKFFDFLFRRIYSKR